MIYAAYELGDALLTVLWIFGFVIFFWLLVAVFGDLFRDHEMSGWAKALWVIFVIALPFLGILAYLIVRGGSMHERAAREQAQQDAAVRQYVRQAAGDGPSPAEEVAKLASLHDQGVLDDEEYRQLKAKALA